VLIDDVTSLQSFEVRPAAFGAAGFYGSLRRSRRRSFREVHRTLEDRGAVRILRLVR
jgi:hypothetical protein